MFVWKNASGEIAELQISEPLREPRRSRQVLCLAARRRLREARRPRPEDAGRAADRHRRRESVAVERALAGDQAHLQLAAAPALANHQIAQEARMRAPVPRLQPLLAAEIKDGAAGIVDLL